MGRYYQYIKAKHGAWIQEGTNIKINALMMFMIQHFFGNMPCVHADVCMDAYMTYVCIYGVHVSIYDVCMNVYMYPWI